MSHPVDELLTEWARWLWRENKALALGYAMGGYAERVGGGAYRDNAPDFDPDVSTLDELIRTRLPQPLAEILVIHYAKPGKAKQKYGGSSSIYYAQLKLAKESLYCVWDSREKTAQQIQVAIEG